MWLSKISFRVAVVLAGLVLTVPGCEQHSEWEKHITEEEIVIPGVKGEYDLFYLTDTHAVIRHESDSEEVTEYATQRAAEFVNEEGVSSKQIFSDWMDYAAEEEFDAILLGGDMIDFPSDASMNYLDEELNKLPMPYLFNMGNHDWTYPWEYMTEAGEQTYRPLFEDYTDGQPSIHTWETEDLLVIAVDNSSEQVRPEVLETYEQLLNTKKPVIVMVHVPLITDSALSQSKKIWGVPMVLGGGNYGGIYPNEDSQAFMELTTAKDSPVELVLAGHVHFYNKDYIDGEKPVLQIIGDAGFHGGAVKLHISGE